MERCPSCGAANKGRQTCGGCGAPMTPVSPVDSPTATRRVSDDRVTSDLEHARLWRKTIHDKFLLSAGYPADLRDSRTSEAALRAEIAELKRRLEEAEGENLRLSDDEMLELARATPPASTRTEAGR